MNKENIITKAVLRFTDSFKKQTKNKNLEVSEINDEIIENVIREYFEKKTLTEANNYFHDVLNEYVKNTYEDIDWSLGRPEVEKTQAYQDWSRHSDISYIWYGCNREADLENYWVDINGKAHTDEEAAKIAADKWCELLFGWHLQDNGALNETHGGGFPACALATVLANDAKEGITDEMKNKAHDLLNQYYLRLIHYNRTNDNDDIKWLKENLVPDDDFDWEYYGFRVDMYCDYGPSSSLYIILLNAGIPKDDIECICPWKTGISIRREDNAVMYNTYRHVDEL